MRPTVLVVAAAIAGILLFLLATASANTPLFARNYTLLLGLNGVIALGLYGFVATLQPDANFGRILAAYGGVFVAGSLVWGMMADGFKPDRYDVIGALICLMGVAVIMYAPRSVAP